MKRYVFDIEANGFLDDVTKIWCIVIVDVDTNEIFQFRPHEIKDALKKLDEADVVIGHNIIKYDLKVLAKVCGWRPREGVVVHDTLVMVRVLFSDIQDQDFENVRKGTFPGKYVGQHGLEAWGYRIGEFKSEYEGGFDAFNEEMYTYNRQDGVANRALYLFCEQQNPPEMVLWIEHEFARIIADMENNGFTFNTEAAQELYLRLIGKRLELADTLKNAFPPKEMTEVFIPKVNNSKRGYVKGEPFTKRWYVEFNPASRQQVGERLIGMGWKPQKFTPTGQPVINEDILEEVDIPEAAALKEYFLLNKRIGQLAEGDQAWLKLETRGKIHGNVNTNGAVTGRCTHSTPNVAQVPAVGSPYGEECRALFGPRKGWVLVGADLSGLELRCLAHFMGRYDKGAYGDILLTGDVHTANQRAAGLPTRSNAKTFIYAFLYGAGDHKIGSIVGVTPDEIVDMKRRVYPHPYKPNREESFSAIKQRLRKKNPDYSNHDVALCIKGRFLKAKFLSGLPALHDLIEAVEKRVKAEGRIRGLDGRWLHIRSPHAALNTLLQSAGALIAKAATIFLYRDLCQLGYKWGRDWALCAHVHDEVQIECRPELAEIVGKTAVEAMRKAGEFFDFRIRIDGEYKIGNNWAETH